MSFSAGFESESFAVGVRPSDKRLLQALNQAFIELYQEGKFKEISQKMVWRRCSNQRSEK